MSSLALSVTRASPCLQVWRDGDIKLTDLAGVRALSAALKSNVSLTSLDVGGSGKDAALVMVRAVRQHDRIKTLGLPYCDIGPSGAKEIAEYMRASGALTSLNLAYNRLCGIWGEGLRVAGTYDPSGIKAIADALRDDGPLTQLNLVRNDIGDEVKGALREIAAAIPSLTLDLGCGTGGKRESSVWREKTGFAGESTSALLRQVTSPRMMYSPRGTMMHA